MTFSKEVEAEIEQRARLVHRTRGNIDVDEHLAHSRADRLEVSAPQNDTIADILLLTVREETANVEWVIQRWLHAYDDIQSLKRH